MSHSEYAQRASQPRRGRIALAVLLGTSILAGGVFSVPAFAADPAPVSLAPLAPVVTPTGFADLVAKAKPAVVNISSTETPKKLDPKQMPQFPQGSPFAEMFRHYFEQQQGAPRNALGSGFIIDPSGYVVTNNHVVEGASKVTVTLTNGAIYNATVKGRDEKTDLALLKIDAKEPFPYVQFGDSDKAREGDWVIAVGNPFGLGGSVTAGIVSAHGRNINAGPYDDFIQIDAPINPGNSGGPLFNQSGQVIGIDAAIYSPNGGSVGIGFAIPSNLASKVIAELRDKGSVSRGWLGVQMQPLTPDLAKALGRKTAEGVVINQVRSDSPAGKSDLKQGDVVLGFNGGQIKNTRDLAQAVADTHAGDRAKLTIWRDGKERTVDVTIGTLPDEKTAAADEKSGDSGQVGMAFAPLDRQTRGQLGLDSSAHGVVVANVTPGSKAAESGVRAGDVIVRVGPDEVNTPSDAIAKIKAAEKSKKEALPLLVMRDGTTYYLALQLAS